MKIGFRKTYITALILLFSVGIVLFVDYVFNSEEKDVGAYVYANPSLSIEDIQLDVFYVVPKDKEPYIESDFSENLKKTVDEVVGFHKNQFLGKSQINATIHSETIILENEGFFYDTNDTSRGNPRALESITLEIERRFFSEDSDAFRVIAIIYEGLGAAGTEGSLILSRDFISKIEYDVFRPSLFYHELGHAIGIPEGYNIETGQAYTNDIMGAGRREPINTAYIDKETLKEMGVF